MPKGRSGADTARPPSNLSGSAPLSHAVEPTRAAPERGGNPGARAGLCPSSRSRRSRYAARPATPEATGPASTAAPSDPAAAAPENPPSGGDLYQAGPESFSSDARTPECRVLLVEDDEDLREALSTILRRNGYLPVEAENGHDALKRLREEPLPAVIVLDVAMPMMDGWQFRSEQQKDPRFAGVPVIVFTADGNAAGIAARMRAAGYLQKAAALDGLLAEIGRVCLRDTEAGSAPGAPTR